MLNVVRFKLFRQKEIGQKLVIFKQPLNRD